MTNENYLDFRGAKEIYRKGENVTNWLRQKYGLQTNTDSVIETAYDLQAGTYSRAARENMAHIENYTTELADIINHWTEQTSTILDVGTGELTTLSFLANKLKPFDSLLAFDLSWSRLWKGLQFAREVVREDICSKINAFSADIAAIPLLTQSIDVVISSHALEPNGGREEELLRELFRVARKKVILFEPCYERNSEDGQKRMTSLGYIRDLCAHAEKLNARDVEMIPIKKVSNALNPTYAYIITPPLYPEPGDISAPSRINLFSDPGSNYPLIPYDHHYFSPNTGLSYPMIRGIPILRKQSAILTSAMEDPPFDAFN